MSSVCAGKMPNPVHNPLTQSVPRGCVERVLHYTMIPNGGKRPGRTRVENRRACPMLDADGKIEDKVRWSER